MAGSREQYDYALQTLTEVPYDSWREYDPEDTMRFYALRLHEAGMITSSPNADHRRRHRLALPQRAQARAEGVSMRPGCTPELSIGGGLLMQIIQQNRRDFLASLSAAAPRASLAPGDRSPTRGRRKRPRSGWAKNPSICVAPWYIAEDLLRAEGSPTSATCRGPARRATRSRAARSTSTSRLRGMGRLSMDAGEPITALAGVHPGCFELFAHEPHPQPSAT